MSSNASFMSRIQSTCAPNIFMQKFQKPSLMYPKRFSKNNLIKPNYRLIQFKDRISIT